MYDLTAKSSSSDNLVFFNLMNLLTFSRSHFVTAGLLCTVTERQHTILTGYFSLA